MKHRSHSASSLAIVLVLFTVVTTGTAAATEDLTRPLPRLERLLIAARTLYGCGEGGNEVAAVIIPHAALSRANSVHALSLDPDSYEFAVTVGRTVFHPVGAHTNHLSRDLHRRLVAAFVAEVFRGDTAGLHAVEVGSRFGGSLPGDDEDGDDRPAAPTALGLIDGDRILIMRGMACR